MKSVWNLSSTQDHPHYPHIDDEAITPNHLLLATPTGYKPTFDTSHTVWRMCSPHTVCVYINSDVAE